MSPSKKKPTRRRKGRPAVFGKKQAGQLSIAAAVLLFSLYFFQPLLDGLWQDLGLGEAWLPLDGVSAPAEGQAQVHFIDVGQASCTLIVGSEKTALIDAGEASTADEVIAYLGKQRVEKIDYFFNTHPHADHMGGSRAIMEAVSTGEFIETPLPNKLVPTTVGYEKLLDYLSQKKGSITSGRASPGDQYNLGGGLTLTVLGPTTEYKDLNDQSIVLRMDFGSTPFLFTGDIEAAAQQDLFDAGLVQPVAVLQAPHHGSNSSIDPAFMKAILPGRIELAQGMPELISVISCGAGNDYGHPSPETMSLYKELGIQAYRTDQQGTVVVTTDGETLTVETQR